MSLTNRKYALIAGISLILMAIVAGYAFGYVHNNLVVADDPATTFTKLKNSRFLFGTGVIGWLVIFIMDLLVAWSLYKYFASVQQTTSLYTGLIRGVYSLVLGFAIIQLVVAWQLLNDSNATAELLMEKLDHFETYWSLGLILFGLHLVGLGYLSLKSKEVPKWLGWLLYFAGVCYTMINGAKATMPNAAAEIAQVEIALSAPMAVAEIGLAIWLTRKGGRKK